MLNHWPPCFTVLESEEIPTMLVLVNHQEEAKEAEWWPDTCLSEVGVQSLEDQDAPST